MSRKLPLCAWCGDPLARKAYTCVMLEALPGKPQVGWHWSKTDPAKNCVALDPHWETFNPKDSPVRGADKAYAEIEGRGPGRVVRLTTKRAK